LEFTFANTNIPLTSIVGGEPQTNTIAANSITWYQVNVPDGALYATNLLLTATAPVNVWFSTNSPPTTNHSGDVVLIANSTGGSATLSPVTSPPLLPDETYYLGVQNPNSVSVTYAIEVNFFIPQVTPILGGQPQTNVIPEGGAAYYWVYVPNNADFATNLLLSATGPVNLWFNQTYLPTGNNPPDFLLLTNSTGGSSVLGTNTVPPLLPGQVYFLELQNTNSFAVTNVLEVNFHLLNSTSAPVTLSIIHTNIGGTNGFLLTWYAPTNDEFLVQWSGSLTPPITWGTFTNIVTYTGPPTPTNGLFSFFDDGSQTGGVLGPIRFYRLLLINTLASGVPQTGSVSAGGIDYFLINVPTNADFATNTLLSASAPLNIWYDTNTPPTTNVFLFSGTNGSYTLSTTGAPPLVPGGFYWLGVQNTNSFAVTFTGETFFHLLTSPGAPTNPIIVSGVIYTSIGGTNGFLLTWYAPTNDEFLVQWSGSLTPPITWNTFTNIVAYTGPPTPTNGLFTFFDNGSQTGGVLGPTRFYRLILLQTPTNGVPQMNSVSGGGFDYYLINVPTNADFATNTLLSASAPVNIWYDTNTPPATNVFLFSGTNGSYTLSTTGAPPLVPGGFYWLGVQNTNSFTVSFGLEVNFQLLSGGLPSVITLTSGIPYANTNSGAGSATDYYLYTVPTNAARAQFEVDNPGGEVALVARSGLPLPGLTNFNYLSENPSTNGQLIVVLTNSTPVALAPGNWYLAVVNISGAPVAYSVMATEWPVTGRPFNVTGTRYTPPQGANSGDFCITWTSLPAAYYYVQGITNLTSTNWVAVSPTILATTNATTYCVTLPSPFSFFQVVEGIVVN
jgi:hypothetical protein